MIDYKMQAIMDNLESVLVLMENEVGYDYLYDDVAVLQDKILRQYDYENEGI
jgi:hypothetical protein